MSDGKIQIDTEINTQDAESGLKELTSKLKSFGKGSAVIAGVTTAAKMLNKTVKETSQLYRTQAKAEKQLEAAAKNNPYLSTSSVKQLKEYASYLQSISTYGDEQLIPLMSQLASAGRTQTEIQDIMSAALDVSATGMMSLDSAVQSLNSSYSGNVGLLGRQISELKDLTTEDLKNGKAIEVIKEKFKGVSEEVTKATGSSEQLKNAWGDLKEEVGATFEKKMSPMRTFFTELITGWTDAAKSRRLYEEVKDKTPEELDIEQLKNRIEGEKKKLEELQNGVTKSSNKTIGETIRDSLFIAFTGQAGVSSTEITKGNDAEIQAQETVIDNLEKELKLKEDNLDADIKARIEADARKKAEKEAEQSESNKAKTRAELRASYDETIRQAQEEINQRRQLGEEITKQEEAQTLLNTATDAYVTMMSDPAFIGVTEDNTHEVNARSQIAQWAEDAKELPEVVDNFDEFKEKVEELAKVEKEAKEQELQLLDTEFDALSAQDKAAIFEKYVDARKKLSDELKQIEEDEVQSQKEKTAEMFNTVNDYISKFASINDTITDLMTSANETQTNTELTALEDQYEKGLVTYEDYCEKKEEINKKSAQEQYKINMWTWTASLLEATANIAQGVSAALSQTPPYSYIAAGLTAAAGAAQIASITASKPIAPSFATGGIVQGTSYTGDNVKANVNSGEMILNAAQQAELWKMANGSNGSGSVVNMPVTIENNNGSNVSAQMDQNGLRVVIDNIVNAGFQSGRYSQSMNVANNKTQGVRYL